MRVPIPKTPRSKRHSIPWTASATRSIPISADVLSRVIRDGTSWPEWQPEIVRSTGPDQLGAGDVVLGDAEMLGFKVAGRSDIRFADERTVDQDVIVGIRMRVTYELQPLRGGTAVTHRLTADLPRGLSGLVLSFFLRARLRKMQHMLLENLAKIME